MVRSLIDKEIDIQKSLEISQMLYYRVMLNISKIVLDFIGVGSIIAFLLIRLLQNPLTLNISLLVFSTTYVVISWKMSRFVYPLVKTFSSNKSLLIAKKFPSLIKLTYVLSLILLNAIFLLSFYVHSLSILPAFLVGGYISFIGSQLITNIRFLKERTIEYFLVLSYIISGISIALSPFSTITILIPPLLALLYKLVRRAQEWS